MPLPFRPALVERPEIVAGTKIDPPGAEAALDRFRAAFPDGTVLGLSAVASRGLAVLVREIVRTLERPGGGPDGKVREPGRVVR